MNRLKLFAFYTAGVLLCAGLGIAVVYGSGINDNGGPGTGNQNAGNGGGSSNSTNINNNDSLKTSAVRCFGAAQIVWTVRAATGIDSAIVCQVSQDSTHWSGGFGGNVAVGKSADGCYMEYIGAVTSGTTIGAYATLATGDSLNWGPHTVQMVPGEPAGVGAGMQRAIQDRYAHLLLLSPSQRPITGLRITCRVVYPPGASESDYANAYTDSP